MENYRINTDELISDSFLNKIYITFFIAGIVANTLGAASNLILFGFSITSIVCLACLVLVGIISAVARSTREYKYCAIVLIVILAFFEFPFLIFSYREAAIPYLILGAYGTTILVRERAGITLAIVEFIVSAIAFGLSFAYPDIYKQSDALTIYISAGVATTITIVVVVVTLIFCLNSYSDKAEEYKVLTDRLDKLNRYDGLTPCFNRKFLMDYLYINAAAKINNGLSIITLQMIDIIYINNKYGYSVGDNVLVAFTKICSEQVRDRGVVTRFDGEKFVLALNITNEDEVKKLINEIKNNFKAYAVKEYKEEFGMVYGYVISSSRFQVDEIMKECSDRCFEMASSYKRKVITINAKK